MRCSRRALVGRKEVATPISAVTGVDGGIQLNITRRHVQELPPGHRSPERVKPPARAEEHRQRTDQPGAEHDVTLCD
jgi:hypothetical protein